MTVAAVVLAATPDSALADADGMPSVRRIADSAWSGGAVPIVVVAHDPDGSVSTALMGSPVTLAEPAPLDHGPVGQIVRGIEVAVGQVRETDAALVWPARFTWVGPETATSLIEAHGTAPGALLRPSYEGEAGWPVLVPVALLDGLGAVAPDRMPDDVVADIVAGGAREVLLELGDPGVRHDRTVPRASLPAYIGPTEPPAGHVHEWEAAMADVSEEVPLQGPALAPYGQAAAEDPDQPG
ncbi:MAG TPA: NTP transferase domain-containing protein [Candidatus Limnocylindrales bacterium]|nr:NTP transferase domain-containing protein [Candidatus Limnocylindrales bacterium]